MSCPLGGHVPSTTHDQNPGKGQGRSHALPPIRTPLGVSALPLAANTMPLAFCSLTWSGTLGEPPAHLT